MVKIQKKVQVTELKDYAKGWLRRLAFQMGSNDYDTMLKEKPSRDVIEYIQNSTKSESWKEQMLYSTKTWYSINGEKRNANTLKKLAFATTDKRNEEYKKHEVKEDWMTQDQIISIRDKYVNYKNEYEMYTYLILCLITLSPPLRPQTWATMKIVRSKKDVKNDDVNYLYYTKRGKINGYYYVNNDKVSEAFTHIHNKQLSVNSELLKVIDDTLVKYPREMLFNFNIKKKEDKMRNMLQKATKNTFGFSMARSSYRTFHLPPHATIEEREELARKMRHSNTTAEKIYDKAKTMNPVGKTDPELNLIIDNKDNVILAKDETIFKLEEEIKVLKTELSKYKKFSEKEGKKQEKQNTAVFAKKRHDLIYTANRQKTKIKQTNLSLYKIKFNQNTKLYE